MDDYAASQAALQGQCQVILAMVRPLDEAAWYAPSRLPGWDNLTLVAHTMRALTTLQKYASTPVAPNTPPTHDRVTYWHRVLSEIAEDVSQRALESAAQTSPDRIVADFEQNLAAASGLLAGLPADTIIPHIGGFIEIAEYVPTRLLELGVHGLDIAASLHQPMQLDPAAQNILVANLTALLDAPRPAELSDDIAFIEAATGRTPGQPALVPAFR